MTRSVSDLFRSVSGATIVQGRDLPGTVSGSAGDARLYS